MKSVYILMISLALGFTPNHSQGSDTALYQDLSLPLPYKKMSDNEKKEAIFLVERAYTILDDRLPEKVAVVGSISPCIFVGIRNNKLGKAIIAHKHYSNNFDQLLDVFKEQLSPIEPKNILVKLYTCKVGKELPPKEAFWDDMENIVSEEDFEEILDDVEEESEDDNPDDYWTVEEIREKHQGRTQEQELKLLKEKIIREFGITNSSQVSTVILPDPTYRDLGSYFLAAETIYTNSSLNVYCTSPSREGILSYPLPLTRDMNLRINVHAHDAETLRVYIIKQYHSAFQDKDELEIALDTYGRLPFQPFNLSGDALQQVLVPERKGQLFDRVLRLS